MKEVPGSSETSILTKASRRNIPEDSILQSSFRLLVTATVVLSTPNFVTLMMEEIRFETSVLIRATRRIIPDDVVLHSHRCEKLKYCII
jgi:hypothetical protein